MALKIAKSKLQSDPALKRGDPEARGDRKVLVTERWAEKERLATHAEWEPPEHGQAASVMEVDGLEFAFFTEAASQDRHHHQMAFEIYTVLEGSCVIEVEGQHHALGAGDSLVVSPGERHEVLSSVEPFLAQVLVTPCGGARDKFPDSGSLG
ncbi:MAG: cupin domain-containing protein [Myxococcota bacterium]